MKGIISPGLGSIWYVCGNCQSFRIIIHEDDNLEEKKATMAEHAKPCRKERGV